MNILVINGPNLNILGIRQPDIYGSKTYHDLVQFLLEYADANEHYLEAYQSNHEGELIDLIQDNYHRFDGIIINPAALTHTSYALYDCLLGTPIPAIEVHLTDINQREPFRKISLTKPACLAQFCGKGFQSYIDAIEALKKGIIPHDH